MTKPSGRSPATAVAIAGGVTIVGILPVHLMGAMSVQLRADLAIGPAGLGLAGALFRGSAAVVSPLLGRFTDRFGGVRSVRLAAILSATTCLGIAVTTQRFWVLLVWLGIGGWAHALGQPGANRMLSNAVRSDQLGAAFGIKQSSPPTSSMLAGLAAPVIALSLGWRYAYVFGTLAALAVAFVARPLSPRGVTIPRVTRADRPRLRNRRLLALAMAGVGLGTVASTALTTFYVDAAVLAGTSQTFAGVILAVASVAAILTRLVFGFASDRLAGGHLRVCAALMLAGGVGTALLASNRTSLMPLGAVIGLAGTWGFNGVFWYAMMKAYPDAPGTVSGVVFPGALVGGTLGPIVVGALASSWSYQLGWVFCSVVTACGSFAMLLAAQELPRNGSGGFGHWWTGSL